MNEEETPLPRSWSTKDKYQYIGLSQSNLRVHYKVAISHFLPSNQTANSSLVCQIELENGAENIFELFESSAFRKCSTCCVRHLATCLCVFVSKWSVDVL